MNPYVSKPKVDKNITIPIEVLKDLLTPSEVRMLKNRWQIASFLDEGLSIRAIAQQAKVGTDTVVRVARMIEKKGFKKITKNTKKSKLPFKTNTPWIFGKSNDR